MNSGLDRLPDLSTVPHSCSQHGERCKFLKDSWDVCSLRHHLLQQPCTYMSPVVNIGGHELSSLVASACEFSSHQFWSASCFFEFVINICLSQQQDLFPLTVFLQAFDFSSLILLYRPGLCQRQAVYL